MLDVLAENGNEFTYESLSKMTYLDQLIGESLRIFPPVTTIHRVVTKNYTLPNGAVLEAGNLVVIPNLAFQRDPEIFPDPLRFNPDRFDEHGKRKRHPFSSLPFGEGKVFNNKYFGQRQSSHFYFSQARAIALECDLEFFKSN